jgi:HTH-type transcriptional regulator, sugar sensing transcriptional regulator
MLTEQLKETGLSSKEAQIYDILLDKGVLPVNAIVSLTGLKRGITYKILKDLQQKGLIKEVKGTAKLTYKCANPTQLSNLLDNKIKETQQHKATLQALLPQLLSTYNILQNEPGVKVFEGVEGIKDIYRDTLKVAKPIYAILQTSEVESKLYSWLRNIYVKERTEQNIWANVIVAEDTRTSEYVSKNLIEKRETRVVPKDKFPIGIELDIYGDKAAFINFNKKDQLIGILIQNKLIADTMKAIFDLAWESAKKYD